VKIYKACRKAFHGVFQTCHTQCSNWQLLARLMVDDHIHSVTDGHKQRQRKGEVKSLAVLQKKLSANHNLQAKQNNIIAQTIW